MNFTKIIALHPNSGYIPYAHLKRAIAYSNLQNHSEAVADYKIILDKYATHPVAQNAILGLQDDIIEKICREIDHIVVPANYNSPGQLVISGTKEGIARACEIAKEKGAKRAIELAVNGAFHSPLMEPARLELAEGIEKVAINDARIPVYQNFTAKKFSF